MKPRLFKAATYFNGGGSRVIRAADYQTLPCLSLDADGLRTTFADVVAIPLPAQLAALTRRLDALGEEPGRIH